MAAGTGTIASDDDAFEAVICRYSAGEFEALLQFSAQHLRRNQWPQKARRAEPS